MSNKNNGSLIALLIVVGLALVMVFFVAGYAYRLAHNPPPKAPTELVVE